VQRVFSGPRIFFVAKVEEFSTFRAVSANASENGNVSGWENSPVAEVNQGMRTIPLRLPEDLAAEVERAAAETRLSRQDVMRLAIERGVAILLAQLAGGAAPAADCGCQPERGAA
jgi:hypothetical protein